ncbi:MAG: sigma-54-dependent Fis family transcriptional regulator, partial [Proteobacteria bacterium]|nr:sigma-54-dependent Fis family transcriptional regulator [Pseudomonadota bacterium]
RRAAHDRLWRHALPELESLAEALADARVVAVLAGPDGLILDTIGSGDFMSKAERVALMPGVDWSESRRGTNAIGTALKEQAPVTVLGPQHYLQCNGILGCTSAPLVSPDGRLLGVLDVTGNPRGIQPQTLWLLRMAAQHIEHRMALNSAPQYTEILRFGHDPALLGSHREALLWVRNGAVVGANRAALRSLGLPFDQLRGRPLTSLFGSLPAEGRGTSQLVLLPEGVRPGQRSTWVARWAEPPSSRGIAIAADLRAPAAGPGEPPVIGDPERDIQLERAVRVLESGIPVLVLGESGVGKEVFSRQLHAASRRRAGPFVAINCAAVPEGLIEAELFGYEEGAFTGAKRKGYAGLIRQAQGGILFLDEIGDMPLALQARLLRVLQDREVKSLGGSQAQAVDFALVCATHRALDAMVAQGQFRADLYYRLQHFIVRLRPLRELPDAAEQIGRLLDAMLHQREVRLSPQAREALLHYEWPGNWRQLVGAAQTLIALADRNSCIELGDLPLDVRDAWIASSDGAAAIAPAVDAGGGGVAGAQPANLRLVIDSNIAAAIAACDGNISRAADLLGVHRSTLHRHLTAANKPDGGSPAAA